MGLRVEFGFVAICLSEQACSPAGSVTVKLAASLGDAERRSRILRTAKRNLENTLRIMWFLRAHGIRLYRISANMIPLATHPLTAGWAWWEEPELTELGEKIGRVAREEGYLLSSHLPEVCGLTSEAQASLARDYLRYHERLFALLHLEPSAKIVMHVGGASGDKAGALAAARARLEELTPWERERLVLENDDRVFSLSDILPLAAEAGVAIAFDWHHHWCNGASPAGCGASPPEEAASAELLDLLLKAFSLWRDRPPKIHLSSPKGDKKPRAHADYVDPRFVRPLLSLLAEAGIERVDAMIEAKMKDLALLRLREELGRAPAPGR